MHQNSQGVQLPQNIPPSQVTHPPYTPNIVMPQNISPSSINNNYVQNISMFIE